MRHLFPQLYPLAGDAVFPDIAPSGAGADAVCRGAGGDRIQLGDRLRADPSVGAGYRPFGCPSFPGDAFHAGKRMGTGQPSELSEPHRHCPSPLYLSDGARHAVADRQCRVHRGRLWRKRGTGNHAFGDRQFGHCAYQLGYAGKPFAPADRLPDDSRDRGGRRFPFAVGRYGYS